MVHYIHRNDFRRAGAFQPTDDCNPGGMKADVFEAGMLFAKLVEKFKPKKAVHFGAIVGKYRSALFGIQKLFQKWHKGGIKVDFVGFSSFGVNGSNVCLPVNSVSQVDVCFAEPKPLEFCDFERHRHEVGLLFFFWGFGGKLLFVQRCFDDFVLFVGDFRFDGWRISANAQPVARIIFHVLSIHGFGHNPRENPQLGENCVYADRLAVLLFTIQVPRFFATPRDVSFAVFALKLVWGKDANVFQVGINESPNRKIFLQRLRRTAELSAKKRIYPECECVAMLGCDAARLLQGILIFNVNGVALFGWVGCCDPRGESLLFAGRRVFPFYPEVRTVWSCIKAGHQYVPQCAQTNKQSQKQTNKFKQSPTVSNSFLAHCRSESSNLSLSAICFQGFCWVGVPKCALTWVWLLLGGWAVSLFLGSGQQRRSPSKFASGPLFPQSTHSRLQASGDRRIAL